METINVTLDAITKPRPENEGDIYHKKERVGTFIRENGKPINITFFNKEIEYTLWDLEYVITMPCEGTPTFIIGSAE